MNTACNHHHVNKLYMPFSFGPVPLGTVDYACCQCESLIPVPLSEDATPPTYVQCPRCAGGVMVQVSD